MAETKRPVFWTLAAMTSATALFLFYRTYVPLLPTFQAVVLPLCVASALLTTWRPRWGTLFVVFVLPLINFFPYVFGVAEGVPQAPAALALSLFYFFGVIGHRALSGRHPFGRSVLASPMAAASGIVLVSAVITGWRFANFCPLLSDRFYELVTNVNGVTAGGAVMSTVFSALNYLTGFAFFAVLWAGLKPREGWKALLSVLAASLAIAAIFGLYQRFFDPAFGNTAFWIKMGQVNGTFKDPNAFGATLAMTIPLFLGSWLAFRKGARLLFGAALVLGLAIFPFIGARSAFLGLAAGLACFGLFSFASRRVAFIAAAGACAFLVLAFAVSGLSRSKLFERVSASFRNLGAPGGIVNLSPERLFLWKEAVSMASDYPFTGVGIGAYIIELPDYYARDKHVYPPGLTAFRRNDSAENFFLQVAAELGAAGLAAFLWLFWAIAKELRRGFKIFAGTGGASRILFAGGAGGLIAYGVNILFHTGIGSFETNFVFWLIAAVTLGAIPEGERSEDRKPRLASPRKIVFAGVLLAVFGGLHLWNSSRSLSLEAKTAEFRLTQTFGLYAPEKTDDGRPFRWTREYAGVPIAAERHRALFLPILASHPDIKTRPVRVRVDFVEGLFAKKVRLAEFTLGSADWETRELPLDGLSGREGILLVTVSRTWNPLRASGVPDPRDLGVALGAISFRDE